MAERKSVPAIRFSGFSGDWERRRLGDAFAFLQNNTLSRAELSLDHGEAKNVHYGDILVKFGEYLDVSKTPLPFISDRHVVDKFKASLLQDGDVVVADTAEDEAVGKCVEMARVRDVPVISGLHTIPMRPAESFAAGYLGYYLNSNAYHDQLLPLMQGIKVMSVSKSVMRDTDVSFPMDMAEQAAIGQHFIQLDNLIASLERKLAALANFKKTMLGKMFPKDGATVPEIRFAEFGGDWDRRKLGELAQFSKGAGYSKADLKESGTPIILYGRLYTRYETVITDVDTFADAKVGSVYSRGGEVIVPASGETAEDISIASVIEKAGVLLGGDLNIITPSSILDPTFLAISISNGAPHDSMAKMAQGKSVVHLHNADLEKIDLIYPSYDEQMEIGTYFKQLDRLIALQQSKLDCLRNIKKACLEKMFV